MKKKLGCRAAWGACKKRTLQHAPTGGFLYGWPVDGPTMNLTVAHLWKACGERPAGPTFRATLMANKERRHSAKEETPGVSPRGSKARIGLARRTWPWWRPHELLYHRTRRETPTAR